MAAKRFSHAEIKAAEKGSGRRSTKTPSALKNCEGSGDFANGMSHPHISAKQSQDERAEEVVDERSMLIRSSMHWSKTQRNNTMQACLHQSGNLEKFKGALLLPKI
jgi:hypothetical protein